MRDARCGIREFKHFARDEGIEDLHWGPSLGTVNFESLVFETEVTFNGYTIAHHTQKVVCIGGRS